MGDTGGPLEALGDLGHPPPLPGFHPASLGLCAWALVVEGGEEYSCRYSGLTCVVQVSPVRS